MTKIGRNKNWVYKLSKSKKLLHLKRDYLVIRAVVLWKRCWGKYVSISETVALYLNEFQETI